MPPTIPLTRPAPRLLACALLALAVQLGLAGCDSTDPLDADLSGTYTLHSVEDQPLPARFETQLFGTLRVDAGSLALLPGDTYAVSFRGHLDDASGSNALLEGREGTYVRRGDALTFYEDDTLAFTGLVRGANIDLTYRLASIHYEMHMRR